MPDLVADEFYEALLQARRSIEDAPLTLEFLSLEVVLDALPNPA